MTKWPVQKLTHRTTQKTYNTMTQQTFRKNYIFVFLGSYSEGNNVSLGHYKIGSMMQSLREAAGLSNKYINHVLPATTVHVLDSARIPSRHIMTHNVTGHKSESSLMTYSGQTDISTTKIMSRTLGESTTSLKSCSSICAPRTSSDRTSSLNNCLMTCTTNNVPPLTLSSSQELAIIQDIQQDDTFDDVLYDMFMHITIPNNGMPVFRPFPSSVQPLALPVFNNCSDITINYYVNQNN